MFTLKEIGFIKGCLIVCRSVPQDTEICNLIHSIEDKLDEMIKELLNLKVKENK